MYSTDFRFVHKCACHALFTLRYAQLPVEVNFDQLEMFQLQVDGVQYPPLDAVSFSSSLSCNCYTQSRYYNLACNGLGANVQ
jgi:hypothetical protein